MSQTFIHELPQFTRYEIAADVAGKWHDLACALNIEPNRIAGQVVSGAPPIDLARCLIDTVSNRCVTIETLANALQKIGMGRVVERLGRAVPTTALKAAVQPMMGAPNPANPFLVEEQVENLATFVSSSNAFYLNLCTVMNAKMCWKDLLRIYGLLSSPAAAKMVLDLSHDWELRKNNPTDHILRLLAPTKHGQKSLDEFASDLKSIDCADLHKVVEEWCSFRSAQKNKELDANTSVYVANTSLRQFLLKHISTKETVDRHVEMLTAPSIGVQVPEDLADMTAEQFKDAGFSAVQINKFMKALKA